MVLVTVIMAEGDINCGGNGVSVGNTDDVHM